MVGIDIHRRRAGLPSVGELTWGTDLGLFYQTKEDLLDALVGYLKAGLENNEYCVWVVSSPLSLPAARKALKEAVRDFDAYTTKKQIRIVSARRWQADGRSAEAAVAAHVNLAYTRGFQGLRLAGQARTEKKGSRRYVCPGAKAVRRDNAIAAFAYPREQFDAASLTDAVKKHRLALVRNAGKWELIETSKGHVVKDALEKIEERLHSVFSNMAEGFAYHRIVLDAKGRPCDYVFLEVNDAFTTLTGLGAATVIGRKATEVLRSIASDPADWIGKYGQVALNGKPMQFEAYSQTLKRWYEVSAFCPNEGFFVTLFSDVTARREAAERLATLNDELAASNEKLRVETETRAALEEELRTTNEELRGRMDESERTEYAERTTALFPNQNRSPVLRVMYDGRLGFANAASKRLLRMWRCGVGSAVPDEVGQAVAEALDRRRVGEIEITCGRIIYAFSVAPIPAEGYANLYGYDITDRKKAGQSLRHSERRYRSFVEVTSQFGWVTDPDGQVVEDIPSLRQFTGQTYKQAKGTGWADALHPDDVQRTLEVWNQAVSTREQYETEYRMRRHDGAYRTLLARGVPILDDRGNVIEWVGTCIDITERKQAEEALRESEERLRMAQAAGKVGTFDWDLESQMAHCSEEYFRVMGRPRPVDGKVTLDQWRSWLHPDDCDEFLVTLEAVLAGRNDVAGEYRVVDEDGRTRWILYRGQVYCDAEGHAVRMVGTAHDITERRQAEEEKRRNERRLESLLRISQHRADSVDDLLDFALEEAIDLTDSKMGYVYSYDEARQEFTRITWSKAVMEQCAITKRQTVHQLGRTGIWGEAVRQARPIVINDFQAYHPLKKGYPEGHAPIYRYLTTPVFSDGHIVGVIGVANKETDYDDSDVRQLTLLMDSVWTIVEREKVERALRASEQRYRSLFNGMTEGFALHEMIFGGDGQPCDYRFLEINPAFERLTGLTRGRVAGRLVSDVMPEEARKWVEAYAPVAVTGESVHFEEYSSTLKRHFEVFAHRPAAGQFAVLFLDVSERVKVQQALEQANEKLREQTEELQRQTEELTRANGELRLSEQTLVARSQELEAARAAAENERLRLEAVMEALPVGMALTDTKGGTLRHNQAFDTVWGGPRATAHSVRDCGAFKARWAETGKVVMPQEWASVQAVRKGVSTVGQLLEIERFDGTRAFVLDSASPVRDAGGKIVGAAVTIQDITALRRAQELARESEQRLRLALEGGGMAYWERDFDNQTSIWSNSLYEMLGLDPEKTVASSETLYERVHPEDRAALERLVREATDNETDFEAEFRVVRPDGRAAWLASRARIIRATDGRATRMMGVIYDISSRKAMEADLRQLNERLEDQVARRTEELAETVETLRDEVEARRQAEKILRQRSLILEGFFQHTITPLAFMDAEFNFIRVNEAYAQADGKTPEELVGRNHFELYPNEENQAIFERVVRTKEVYHAYARPFTYPQAPQRGTSYWNWLLTPLLDERGRVQFLVLNLEDVTERQRAFDELEKRATQLQRLTLELSQTEDRERQRLAEVLHDDLQQLLVGAKLHLNILAGRARDDVEMGQVVDQVRALLTESISKSRGLSHELSPPVLHQGRLGEALIWLAGQILSTCGLTVEVDADPDCDTDSETLRAFIYKAAQEMLFNVVKHARVKQAKLQLRRLPNYMRLVVSDEGQGFGLERLAGGSGAGFGLFSIQQRVQLLGGWMKFSSAPGKGSTFVLAVPVGAKTEAVDEAAAVAGLPAGAVDALPLTRSLRRTGRRTVRVLLVDDHMVMRQGIAALLDEEPDLEVVGQAGNGRDAVTMAERLRPDVIVMDVTMPVLGGDEATRLIKSRLPQTRIIGLSVTDEQTVSERMLKSGAEMFLSKTDASEKLLAAIRGEKTER